MELKVDYRLLLTFVLVVSTCTGRAPAGAEAGEAAEAYAAVRGEWDAVDGQLDDLGAKFRAASPAAREEIRTQYAELVDKANALLPRLRETGIAAYKESPNQDAALVRLLVGILANDVRHDRYEIAMELAELLIGNECPENAIYGQAGAAAYCLDEFAVAQEHLNAAKEADALPEELMAYLTDVAFAKKLWGKEQEIRGAEAEADDLPRVLLKTSKGEILVELFENEAPQTVGNFVSLVESGFYDGLSFHRVLPGFMAQGGCPDGDGLGGPGYNIYCECFEKNHRKHFRGSLSMAHGRPRDTGGSQFFITFKRTSHLDGVHTVFGRVIEGIEVLEKIQRRNPDAPGPKPEPDKIVEAKVVRKRPHEYKPTKVKTADSE
jgi:cyclophilin family peptidyl-prolyl cis-trans isomerase